MTVRGADLCACLTELKGISKGLTGFSHMYSPDDLNNISLCQGSVLESTLAIGTVDIKCIPRAGEGGGGGAGHVLKDLPGGECPGAEQALGLGGGQDRELQPWARGWEERREFFKRSTVSSF